MIQRANEDVRRAARAAGVPLWMIAAELEISEPTLTRWLRVPLPDDRRDEIMKIIRALELDIANA